MCVNWSTLVVTNFVYMCRSADVEPSGAAILQYRRVGHAANQHNWTPFNYYNGVCGLAAYQLWTLQGL